MSLNNFSQEELERMSMVELAHLLLMDDKKALDFKDIFAKIAEIKGLAEEQQQEMMLQFYTDLNMDGRFIALGSNIWGLKRWYPVEQIDEEITAAPKKKKVKKKKKAAVLADDDFDVDEADIEILEDDDFDVLDDDEEDFDEDDVDDEDDLEEEETEDFEDYEEEEIDEEFVELDEELDEDEEDNS